MSARVRLSVYKNTAELKVVKLLLKGDCCFSNANYAKHVNSLYYIILITFFTKLDIRKL